MNKQADLLHGSIPRQMLQLGIPLLLSGLLQSLYGITDMIIVGQTLGSTGLSGVSMGSQIMQIVTTFSIGLSTGGSVLISQNIRRADNTELRRILGTLTTLFLIVSISLAVIMVSPFGNFLLRVFRTPQMAMAQASGYLRICSIGIPLIFAYNIISGVLRGMGNTRFAFYIALVSAVLNVGLDLLFVPVLKMGAAGSALATVLAQGIAAGGMLLYMLKIGSPMIPRRREEFHMDHQYLKMLLKVGIPAGTQGMVVFLSMLVVVGMINVHGMTVSAAYGACMKVDGLSILPRQAIAQASAVMVGQCFSVSDYKRVSRTVLYAAAMSFAVCILMGAIVWLLAPQLVHLFDNDAAVIAEGCRYLRINVWGYPIVGLMGAFNSLTIGIGFTAFALTNSFLDSIIARILLCRILGSSMGLEGIYLGLVLAPICAAVIGCSYFLLGRWRKRPSLTADRSK